MPHRCYWSAQRILNPSGRGSSPRWGTNNFICPLSAVGQRISLTRRRSLVQIQQRVPGAQKKEWPTGGQLYANKCLWVWEVMRQTEIDSFRWFPKYHEKPLGANQAGSWTRWRVSSTNKKYPDVIQLVEYLLAMQDVAGSSPVVRSIMRLSSNGKDSSLLKNKSKFESSRARQDSLRIVQRDYSRRSWSTPGGVMTHVKETRLQSRQPPPRFCCYSSVDRAPSW